MPEHGGILRDKEKSCDLRYAALSTRSVHGARGPPDKLRTASVTHKSKRINIWEHQKKAYYKRFAYINYINNEKDEQKRISDGRDIGRYVCPGFRATAGQARAL